MCSNSCDWHDDGECDDGGSGSMTAVCDYGTDCNDCGARPEEGTDGTTTVELCTNTCHLSYDGLCDDGGSGAASGACDFGTDCDDCGTRSVAPPDDFPNADVELDVTFPEAGEAVMVVAGADFSATFYGTADPDAGEVVFTGLMVDSDQGELDVILDAEGRPTEITVGSLAVTITYGADGSADIEARENGEVVLVVAGVALNELDFDDLLPGLDTVSGPAKVAACELPQQIDVGSQLAYVRAARSPVEAVTSCAEILPEYAVKGILEGRGYKNVDAVDENHPLARCLSGSDLARVLAVRFCFLITQLSSPVRDSVWIHCRKIYPAEKDRAYCTRFADKTVGVIDRASDVIASSYRGVADAFWDDPDCTCPAQACPANLVCTDGQCVPKCTQDYDCPGEKVCVADGQCVERVGDGEDITFTAEALAGCWTVEITPDVGSDVSQFIYEIDDTGRLERVWAYIGPPDFDLEPGETWIETSEFMRLTVANAGVQGDAVIDTEQFAATNEENTRVTINWGFRSHVFRGCTIWTTATTHYSFLISDATLTGDPPERFEGGAFESPRETTGTINGESAYAEENTTGTADGWRTTCPDASASEVESQEEYASRECADQ